jgi:beta-glucanase (GH16 family)
MISALGLILVLGVGAGMLAAEEVGDSDRVARGSKLLMRDDFNGPHLNENLWNTCHWWQARGCTIATNRELERYWPSQVQVEGGVLKLVADRHYSSDLRHPFASGMITTGPPDYATKSKFGFRFGTATIRARIPSGAGLWPAFWLLPANRNSEPEIDVMEILGDTPETVRMHLHYRDRRGGEKSRGATFTDPDLPSGWHTYSVRWRPRKLVWLVDGEPRFRVTGAHVPRKRMYPVANLAVGGDYPGPPTLETPFPSAYEIDYIEVRR